MADWCTIESDPGVFTLLIENIGVKGVQVEEVIDLDYFGQEDDKVYGLIFLFKYVSNSGYNPNVLTTYDLDLFYAQQVINNACATQAILGILMNNSDKIDVGNELLEFKSFTGEMDPYTKGMCISNMEKVRLEHNKFSKNEPFVFEKVKPKNEEEADEAFHFVSYIHFKNSIYEIDGLREGPILIADNVKNEEWLEKVKPSIQNRIMLYSQNELKFNLMALVPNREEKAVEKEKSMVDRKKYITFLLGGGNSGSSSGDVEMSQSFPEYDGMNKEDLEAFLNEINMELDNIKGVILNERQKKEHYKVENVRRQHSYVPLIFNLLKTLSEKGVLDEVYQSEQKILQEKIKSKKEASGNAGGQK